MSGLNLSVFEIIGPVMIGPSSSHTAGAARLGWMGRALLGRMPERAIIGLHGSFAATGRGHGTDRALLAGLLGDTPDADELSRAPERAHAAGMIYVFGTVDLGEQAHPNSVEMQLFAGDETVTMIGVSLGGGAVAVREIDGLAVAFSCARPTLVCWHEDRRGFLCQVTAALAAAGQNIATLSTVRQARSAAALTVVETDEPLSAASVEALARTPGLRRQRYLPAFV